MVQQQAAGKPGYDISIIRPEIRVEQFKLRGGAYAPRQLPIIRKALRTLHTLELMAQTIYRFQITSERSDLNRQLITAMCNEMGHYQDFQVKLYEYGFRPSPLRTAYWMIGLILGLGSRLLGTRAILRTGIWVESKAVRHYAELLEAVEWDADTRKILEKDQADENGHISRWKGLLEAALPLPVQA